MKRLERIQEALKDSRSKEVIFLSHCILNVNTRYLGGAFRCGSIDEIITDVMGKGVGIIQLPCPEQSAWGGVLKKYLWIAFDFKTSVFYPFRHLILKAFYAYTRFRYRKIAYSTLTVLQDYIKSGFTVRGIIGVDGSPSCGVHTSLDMKKALEFFAKNTIEGINREAFNKELYSICSCSGSGILFQELEKMMHQRQIRVPIYAHNLISEMQGQKSDIWREA